MLFPNSYVPSMCLKKSAFDITYPHEFIAFRWLKNRFSSIFIVSLLKSI